MVDESLAYPLAMILMYAAQMGERFADYGTFTGLIWEMWV